MSHHFVRLCYEDDDYLYIQTKDQIEKIERFSDIGDKTLKIVESPVVGQYYLTHVGDDLLRIRHLSENESLLADFGEVLKKLVCMRKIGSNLNLSKPSQCYAVTKRGVSKDLDNQLESSSADWSGSLVEVFVKKCNGFQNVNDIEIVELTQSRKSPVKQKVASVDDIRKILRTESKSESNTVEIIKTDGFKDIRIEQINNICKIPLSNGKTLDFSGMFHFNSRHPVIKAERVFNYLLHKKVHMYYVDGELKDAILTIDANTEVTENTDKFFVEDFFIENYFSSTRKRQVSLFRALAICSTIPINTKNKKVLELLKTRFT